MARLAGVAGGFFTGVGMLLHGFGLWARRPGIMLLGLIPAAIVFIGVIGALVALGFGMPTLTDWLTPFADDWVAPWPDVLRAAVGAILFAAAIVLAAVTFTALTLAVGDPFYERIWHAVELEVGGSVPDHGLGFWRSVRDSLKLIGLGFVAAIGVALSGLVPVVGAVLAPTLGVVLSGRLLALELSSRPFEARGIAGPTRRAILRGHRAQVLGFGIATQLCFMVPLGAVFAMPAAVAGATLLARSALDAAVAAAASAPQPTRSAQG
ncbi:EI24 domain-containing protein [Agromyces bauzanensis]|uniref:Membrane protein n=1 Tax=Agromyces bauzanensis TaxID=1308924 RepID=A0A917USH5_9MICO|nr:EI24 domain-containing protein [Agromyces bauzanensis]GGJ82658.1 membrane protein [Agromyces bauzanensis]